MGRTDVTFCSLVPIIRVGKGHTSLLNAVRAEGRPSEYLRDFLFPTGTPGSVRLVFGVVAAFLAQSDVDTRL